MKYKVHKTDLQFNSKYCPEGSTVKLDEKDPEVERLVESGILVPVLEEKTEGKSPKADAAKNKGKSKEEYPAESDQNSLNKK